MSNLGDCIANVAKELGLDRKDVEEIADRLKREKARLAAAGDIAGADRQLAEWAGKQAEQTRIAAALRRKQAALNIILRDEFDKKVGVARAAGVSTTDAIVDRLVGSWRHYAGARDSVGARRTSLVGDYIGSMLKGLMSDPDTAHIVKLMRRPKDAGPLWDNVVREMRELRQGGKPGITGSKAAQKTAKLFAEHAELARLEANRAGANIGRLDGWGGPQAHDAQKLLKAGVDRWVADITPQLDLERSFPGQSPEDVASALQEIFYDITTGTDRSISAKQKGDFTGPANLARSMEKHRVLHFADADKWLAYQGKYARGNIVTAMMDHLHNAAHKTALMQVLGPNPQVFLDGYIASQQRELRLRASDPKARADLDRLGKVNLNESTSSPISKAYAVVSGRVGIPGNLNWAHWLQNGRTVMAMAKLGLALPSSFNDLLTFAHAMRFQGKGLLEGYYDAFHALIAGLPGEARKRNVLGLGVISDAIISDFHRYADGDNVIGKMSRAQDAFFKWSGLTGWTDRLTNGFAHASSLFMAEHADHDWAGLDDAYRHVLSLHNIDATRWESVRKARLTDEEGRRFVMPEMIRQLDLPARERRELELDLRSFFHDEASYGVIKGDDRTRMFVTQGTRPGTGPGELFRFIMQFKSFPIAYMQRTLGRTAFGNPGGKADWGGLAEVIAGSILFGYASMTAKDYLKNRTRRDPFKLETMFAAAMQGGGLGLYGDFLFAKHDRFGSTPLESAAGPGLGTLSNVLALGQDIVHGDAKTAKGDALYLALNNTPFINMWYSRAALDLLILNQLQEWASPGTLARRQQQFHKDFGQSYLLPPIAGKPQLARPVE